MVYLKELSVQLYFLVFLQVDKIIKNIQNGIAKVTENTM
ncbi:hypothetical protein H477_5672 [[Clostridium] sordellii ATCC 9714]|nr:hypothetical protein H477_5672 [[Clostridium] sordellii ATCC 9714] [Paeniclostridium sordellii ATCC 9714]